MNPRESPVRVLFSPFIDLRGIRITMFVLVMHNQSEHEGMEIRGLRTEKICLESKYRMIL